MFVGAIYIHASFEQKPHDPQVTFVAGRAEARQAIAVARLRVCAVGEEEGHDVGAPGVTCGEERRPLYIVVISVLVRCRALNLRSRKCCLLSIALITYCISVLQ